MFLVDFDVNWRRRSCFGGNFLEKKRMSTNFMTIFSVIESKILLLISNYDKYFPNYMKNVLKGVNFFNNFYFFRILKGKCFAALFL